MKPKITICIADDHPVFLAGMKSIISLERNLKILGSAENGKKAVELILEKNPDIAILDIEMPEMNGFEVLTEIRKNGLDSKVIFLTMYNDPILLKKAENLGANGFILKENAISEIITCIDQIFAGEKYSNSISTTSLTTTKFQQNTDSIEPPSELKLLSDKEKVILKHIGEGKSNKEIAETIHISSKTVQNHRFNICKKLGLSGSYSLTRFVLENKMFF